jgi:gliding motility-associated-like protein
LGFGDGTDTIGISPVTHTFNINPSSGQTTIGLVMWSPDSACTATKTNNLNIHPVIADFTSSSVDSIWCINEVNTLINQSQNATSYSWNLGNGTTFSGMNPPAVSFSAPGAYNISLAVNDISTGCQDTIEKVITVPPLPQAVATGGDTCQGFSVQLFASGGSHYLWQPSAGLSNDTIPNPVASPAVSTTYTVQVTDINNCSVSKTAPVIIYQPPPEIHMDTTSVIGSPVVVGYAMPDPGYIYTWTPSIYLSCSDCPTPMSHVLENTNYDFLVTDNYGCFSVTSTYNFIVLPVISIDVPTAFTPNGDHENDVIYVNGWGIKRLIDFKIYNRWGQLVYESSDITEGWNGYFNGELQPQDTYVYQAEVETWLDGKKLQKKGMFELIR